MTYLTESQLREKRDIIGDPKMDLRGMAVGEDRELDKRILKYCSSFYAPQESTTQEN